KKAIDKNAGDIKTNTDNIAANKKAIEKNATDIAAKMTSWKLKAGGVEGEAEIKDGNAVTFDVAAKDQGLTVTRDGSTIKYGIEGSKIDISENKTVKELREEAKKHTSVVAGDYTTVTESTNEAGGKKYTVTGPSVKTDNNLTVQDIITGDKKTGYTIGLAKDLKDLNSVSAKTVNAETVKADKVDTKTVNVGDKVTLGTTGLTIKDGPSVTAAGIDAGKNKITGVAAGAVSEKSTEAVNGGQLFGVEQKVNINSRNISILGGKVVEVNNRVNRVGAGAASLAALHPLDFDPDDKWDFAAGYGNYKGANAVAIGAYYRPNEDTMFSVGGSFGGGENMVNAGVSVKLGQGNHVTTSRVAMAKEIKDLRAEVEVLRQAVTGIGQGQTPDPVKMKLFPDIAKNHWAYEAVEELTKQGLLEGYPDGTFGGDRMMTRYEFAEIVYRAMQKGLNVNEKLVQEFEPELERFRIDVITKDKDGNPVIERIRVNEKKKAK
ncbi:YadA C-terminal domain-containing protein, partial [Dialister micraerophilus]|uniref:YadA C-terminal domain-containing protein n=1 Tax=Dialister micraerophilus TaxID=309120 RepID=UPI00254B3C02